MKKTKPKNQNRKVKKNQTSKPSPKKFPKFKKGPRFPNNFKDSEGDFQKPAQSSIKWYENVPSDPEDFPESDQSTISQLKKEAENLLESESKSYAIKVSKNSEQSWMRTVMAKGTARDKMAAYTLMIQDDPIYNLNALRSFVALVKLGKKETPMCLENLTELFTSDLLKPDQKLKPFHSRPLSQLDQLSSGSPVGRKRRLIAWYFEDQLKIIYAEFVAAVQKVANESVEANKEIAIVALAKLLQSNPEHEVILLSSLVNKIGDPNKKIASKAVYCLTQTLRTHPNMKGVLIDEVEKLLFRSNVGQKARFYGVCFLSQIFFKRSDTQLAANLIKLYFSLFKACVKTGDIESRLLGALLSGVNRAYPYAAEAMDSIADQLETMYKVVHIAPFKISLQALSLLFQVSDFRNDVSDRFYSVLYRKILEPNFSTSALSAMFLSLVFRALKKDENIPRVRAIIKRLLQVCCGFPVPMACGTLYTVSQLLRMRPALSGSKLEMVKAEDRIIPSVSQKDPSINSKMSAIDDDSDDEHYEDVKLDENGLEIKSNKEESDEKDQKPVGAWNHKQISGGGSKTYSNCYNPYSRNPAYARAELSGYTELCNLALHFHPTVALFASQILKGEKVSYNGDPLKDFTLSRFLERFVFKNPKKVADVPNSNLFAKRQQYSAQGIKSMPITSKLYLNHEEEQIPVDERYLFRYLKNKRSAAKESKDDDDDHSDVDSIGDDEFDDMLADLMKKKGYKADYDEEDLNFAEDVDKNKSTKSKNKQKSDEEQDGDSDEESLIEGDDDFEEGDGMDQEEEEVDDSDDLNDMEDMGDLDDDDEEIMDFDDDSEEESNVKSKKGKKEGLDSNVFASAEEFSELLEAAGAARDGSSRALSNKDKASTKQLDWEESRDRWLKGFNRFTKSSADSRPHKPKPQNKNQFGVKKTAFKKNKKKAK